SQVHLPLSHSSPIPPNTPANRTHASPRTVSAPIRGGAPSGALPSPQPHTPLAGCVAGIGPPKESDPPSATTAAAAREEREIPVRLRFSRRPARQSRAVWRASDVAGAIVYCVGKLRRSSLGYSF